MDVERWQTAVDTAIAQDLFEESTDGYHDKARILEPFGETTAAPEGKRIKKGEKEDVELTLLERVATVLETASTHGVVLSAVKVLALLRSQ